MPTVDDTNDEMTSSADIRDPENYQQVFIARRKLCKSKLCVHSV